MTNEKKPGFLEGFLAGGEPKQKKPDSPQLSAVKDYIEKLELSPEDRVELGTWLFGQAIRSSIISALEGD